MIIAAAASATAQDNAPAPVAAAPAASAVPASPAPVSLPPTTVAPPAAPTAAAAVKPLPADGVLWKNLSAAQRQALSPLESEWDSLDQPRRRKWLEIAARFSSLPVSEQVRVQERMSDWARLSPNERSLARISFQQAQQIAPESRQAKWEAYQALSPEQRQELADKAAKKTAVGNSTAVAGNKPGVAAGTANRSALDGASKSNLVPNRSNAPAPISVGPTVVQNKPGATTTLINQSAKPPVHQQSGQPKVVASPDLVDPRTLLPRRNEANAEPATRS